MELNCRPSKPGDDGKYVDWMNEKMVLTIYAERYGGFEALTLGHGSIPNDTAEFRTVVLTLRCYGQCAGRLMVLWATFADGGLQGHGASLPIPSEKSSEIKIAY